MEDQNKVRRSREGLRRDEANSLQVPKIFELSGAGPHSPDLPKLHLETVFFVEGCNIYLLQGRSDEFHAVSTGSFFSNDFVMQHLIWHNYICYYSYS